MNVLAFRSGIRILGVNPYVLVTQEQARALRKDWRKPMPVLVQINDKPEKPWRINLMPRGDGSFYLYLHGIVRKESGTQVGDSVRVRLRFDEAYRNGPMAPMPSWFRVPLSKNERAKASWDALLPSRKKEILRYFAALKSEEARSRNLARAMSALSAKPGRFMGRSWKEGK